MKLILTILWRKRRERERVWEEGERVRERKRERDLYGSIDVRIYEQIYTTTGELYVINMLYMEGRKGRRTDR